MSCAGTNRAGQICSIKPHSSEVNSSLWSGFYLKHARLFQSFVEDHLHGSILIQIEKSSGKFIVTSVSQNVQIPINFTSNVWIESLSAWLLPLQYLFVSVVTQAITYAPPFERFLFCHSNKPYSWHAIVQCLVSASFILFKDSTMIIIRW